MKLILSARTNFGYTPSTYQKSRISVARFRSIRPRRPFRNPTVSLLAMSDSHLPFVPA
ncbi:hypothetical protein VT03_30235 [Planctomyces sp. SH-PL14]|nr:hypothetical protein VT03_30235 [Planctomyces sp. SH-PL14]